MPGYMLKWLFSFGVSSSMGLQPPWSAPSSQPKWFVHISDLWAHTCDGLMAHLCEMRYESHDRSLGSVDYPAFLFAAQAGVAAAESLCFLQQMV